MFNTTSGRRRSLAATSLVALVAPVAFASTASAEAEIEFSFEEVAEADLTVPHRCDDGSIVDGRLVIRTNRFYESPATEDPTPTLSLLSFQAVCSGSTFSWRNRRAVPATITSTENLKSLTAAGTAIVTDNSGGTHTVDFDVAWTGVGAVQTTTSPIQRSLVGTSIRKQREATVAGDVTYDGSPLLAGEGTPRFLSPFIRTDEERYTRPN